MRWEAVTEREKAVTEERDFVFLGEGENWREGDFFFLFFLEGCLLEEENWISFAEEYPFSLRGSRESLRRKQGERKRTREWRIGEKMRRLLEEPLERDSELSIGPNQNEGGELQRS